MKRKARKARKNPLLTRAFWLAWDNSYNDALYITERESPHEATGVVFGSGVVALSTGATYESLDELDELIQGEMNLIWIEADRWTWLRTITTLFLVLVFAAILAAWHWLWFGFPTLAYEVALMGWYLLSCYHVALLHRSGAFDALLLRSKKM